MLYSDRLLEAKKKFFLANKLFLLYVAMYMRWLQVHYNLCVEILNNIVLKC